VSAAAHECGYGRSCQLHHTSLDSCRTVSYSCCQKGSPWVTALVKASFREHQNAGGQAAGGSSSSCRSGYQRWNTVPSSWGCVAKRAFLVGVLKGVARPEPGSFRLHYGGVFGYTHLPIHERLCEGSCVQRVEVSCEFLTRGAVAASLIMGMGQNRLNTRPISCSQDARVRSSMVWASLNHRLAVNQGPCDLSEAERDTWRTPAIRPGSRHPASHRRRARWDSSVAF
jgi:hypothetical protein